MSVFRALSPGPGSLVQAQGQCVRVLLVALDTCVSTSDVFLGLPVHGLCGSHAWPISWALILGPGPSMSTR